MIRILGRQQYGIYSYFFSLISISIIPVEYGISNLIIRETARAESNDQANTIIGLWWWSFRITLWVSLSLIGIILIILYSTGKSWVDEYQLFTLLWGLPLILIQSMIHLSSAALRGMKRIILGQVPNIIIIPLLFIVFFVLGSIIWPNDLSPAFAMAIRLFASIIALIASIIFLLKNTPREIFTFKPLYNKKYWLLSVIPFGFSTGLNIMKSHASILILGFFVSPEQIASYQVAVSAAAIAVLVLHSMNTLLAPQFASLFANNEKRKLQKLVTLSARAVLSFNLVISFIFILFGKQILMIAFGAETVDAYPAVLILLVGQLINSFIGSVAFLLNMTGHEKDVMIIVSISTVLNIVLTFLIAPRYGILGAAIANSASIIFDQIAMFFYVRKRLGIIGNALGK